MLTRATPARVPASFRVPAVDLWSRCTGLARRQLFRRIFPVHATCNRMNQFSSCRHLTCRTLSSLRPAAWRGGGFDTLAKQPPTALTQARFAPGWHITPRRARDESVLLIWQRVCSGLLLHSTRLEGKVAAHRLCPPPSSPEHPRHLPQR